MFIMQGEWVRLVRYIVFYAEHDNEMQERCISEEHKDEIEQILSDKGVEFKTEEVSQDGNAWIDGLEFESYDKAKEALELGEEGYRQLKYNNDSELQLTAMILDVDYRLGIAEMGVQL